MDIPMEKIWFSRNISCISINVRHVSIKANLGISIPAISQNAMDIIRANKLLIRRRRNCAVPKFYDGRQCI